MGGAGYDGASDAWLGVWRCLARVPANLILIRLDTAFECSLGVDEVLPGNYANHPANENELRQRPVRE